jgi:hypothetical protein
MEIWLGIPVSAPPTQTCRLFTTGNFYCRLLFSSCSLPRIISIYFPHFFPPTAQQNADIEILFPLGGIESSPLLSAMTREKSAFMREVSDPGGG